MSRHSVVAPLLAASLLTDTRRSTVGSGTREDVVPNSYCVRSAVLVVKYVAPAPAASARLVSIGCAGAYDLPEALGSHGGRCELNLWRGWYCWTCVASSRPACSSRVLPRRVEPLPAAAMPYCFVHEVPVAVVVFGARAAAPVVVHAGQFLLSGFAYLQCTRIIFQDLCSPRARRTVICDEGRG